MARQPETGRSYVHVYVDGGNLIRQLLDAELVDGRGARVLGDTPPRVQVYAREMRVRDCRTTLLRSRATASLPLERLAAAGLVLLLSSPFAGCSSSDTTTSSTGAGNVSSPAPLTCVDPTGAPLKCPVEDDRLSCAGDADSCMVLTLLEVTTDGTPEGTCLELAIENRCDKTVHTYSCIEKPDGSSFPAQCWLSTTSPGNSVNVSDCGITGRYLYYASETKGEQAHVDAFCLQNGDFPPP